MSSWEVYDGETVSGPYTEAFIAKNLRRWVSASIKVRRVGTTDWRSVDDHAPFALAAQKAARAGGNGDPAHTGDAGGSAAPPSTKKWTSHWIIMPAAILANLVGAAVGLNALSILSSRQQSNPPPVPSGPEALVSETVTLKDGELTSYRLFLPSSRKIQVTVSASPKAVNVLLMSLTEWIDYQKVRGFGGRYKYHTALSRMSVLSMDEAETVRAGEWRIVVERPLEQLFGSEGTPATATVQIIGH
jgi:hypothetical protein